MYVTLKEVQLNDAIAFAYHNGLSITPRSDTEVRDDDSAVVLEINMTNVRSENDGHVRSGVIPNGD